LESLVVSEELTALRVDNRQLATEIDAVQRLHDADQRLFTKAKTRLRIRWLLTALLLFAAGLMLG
jgi:hypothetical protein